MRLYVMIISFLCMAKVCLAQSTFPEIPRSQEKDILTAEDYFNSWVELYEKSENSGFEIDRTNKIIKVQYPEQKTYSITKVDGGKLIMKTYGENDRLFIETVIFPEWFSHVKSMTQLASKDDLVKSNLRMMSTAAEAYATVNDGNYPVKMSDLTDSTAQYLDKDYCDQVSSGYTFTCEMAVSGYKFTATPVENSENSTVFTITTGGILLP